MKKIKEAFRQIISFQWYHQILLAILALLSAYLLYNFLIWLKPIILVVFSVIFHYTAGEFLKMIWENYKRRRETIAVPLSAKTDFKVKFEVNFSRSTKKKPWGKLLSAWNVGISLILTFNKLWSFTSFLKFWFITRVVKCCAWYMIQYKKDSI